MVLLCAHKAWGTLPSLQKALVVFMFSFPSLCFGAGCLIWRENRRRKEEHRTWRCVVRGICRSGGVMRSTKCRSQERAQALPWQGAPTVPNGAAAVGDREFLRKVKHSIAV